MFDNLIYNGDPNEGNWLKDPAWNLLLIDHSRSFGPEAEMAHVDMTRIDRYLWEAMQRLDEPMLTGALGEWLSEDEIRAILTRRDVMSDIIDELVESHGEASVLLRYGVPPDAATPVGADLVNRLWQATTEVPVIMQSSELKWRSTVETSSSIGEETSCMRSASGAGRRSSMAARRCCSNGHTVLERSAQDTTWTLTGSGSWSSRRRLQSRSWTWS